MAETKIKARRRRRKDDGLKIQQYLTKSSSPEEMLFKINEMIFTQAGKSSRKNLRVPVSVPVTYNVKGNNFKADTYTLSQDGLFVKTSNPADKNSLISISLQLPDESSEIEAEGEVISTTLPDDALSMGGLSGMTVVFRKIKQGDRKKINRYVRSKAKELFRPK
jgi:hypothetical protein